MCYCVQELVYQVEGAQQLFLVFVSHFENGTQDDIVGKAVLNVSSYNFCLIFGPFILVVYPNINILLSSLYLHFKPILFV